MNRELFAQHLRQCDHRTIAYPRHMMTDVLCGLRRIGHSQIY